VLKRIALKPILAVTGRPQGRRNPANWPSGVDACKVLVSPSELAGPWPQRAGEGGGGFSGVSGYSASAVAHLTGVGSCYG